VSIVSILLTLCCSVLNLESAVPRQLHILPDQECNNVQIVIKNSCVENGSDKTLSAQVEQFARSMMPTYNLASVACKADADLMKVSYHFAQEGEENSVIRHITGPRGLEKLVCQGGDGASCEIFPNYWAGPTKYTFLNILTQSGGFSERASVNLCFGEDGDALFLSSKGSILMATLKNIEIKNIKHSLHFNKQEQCFLWRTDLSDLVYLLLWWNELNHCCHVDYYNNCYHYRFGVLHTGLQYFGCMPHARAGGFGYYGKNSGSVACARSPEAAVVYEQGLMARSLNILKILRIFAANTSMLLAVNFFMAVQRPMMCLQIYDEGEKCRLTIGSFLADALDYFEKVEWKSVGTEPLNRVHHTMFRNGLSVCVGPVTPMCQGDAVMSVRVHGMRLGNNKLGCELPITSEILQPFWQGAILNGMGGLALPIRPPSHPHMNYVLKIGFEKAHLNMKIILCDLSATPQQPSAVPIKNILSYRDIFNCASGLIKPAGVAFHYVLLRNWTRLYLMDYKGRERIALEPIEICHVNPGSVSIFFNWMPQSIGFAVVDILECGHMRFSTKIFASEDVRNGSISSFRYSDKYYTDNAPSEVQIMEFLFHNGDREVGCADDEKSVQVESLCKLKIKKARRECWDELYYAAYKAREGYILGMRFLGCRWNMIFKQKPRQIGLRVCGEDIYFFLQAQVVDECGDKRVLSLMPNEDYSLPKFVECGQVLDPMFPGATTSGCAVKLSRRRKSKDPNNLALTHAASSVLLQENPVWYGAAVTMPSCPMLSADGWFSVGGCAGSYQ